METEEILEILAAKDAQESEEEPPEESQESEESDIPCMSAADNDINKEYMRVVKADKKAKVVDKDFVLDHRSEAKWSFRAFTAFSEPG